METTTPRDHGGNLDAAIRRFGGAAGDWLDLSTGINPVPYPLPALSPEAFARLPDRSAMDGLSHVAQQAYGAKVPAVAFNGAQGAIQAIPGLHASGRAAIVAPTYNEHGAALRAGGWKVAEVPGLTAAEGAELAVVVNPNNPDGRRWTAQALLALSETVGLLVVDESFADTEPGLSLLPHLHAAPPRIVVLRSFGKFYGLAGLRLGFALARPPLAARLAESAGPWPVSGPAIEVALRALADRDWQAAATARLDRDAARLDRMAERAGWAPVGGTPLFRTYATPDATSAQDRLARHHVWSRVFPYSTTWLRLGPPPEDRWDQLAEALA
ncbi:threonine-phosphate decarboxylase CobD [Citreimonas salinaria]|uniref:threonine-phosphate decarboxylase n=1 Tax=Citreimonas salinaria TaxID=321339 RepID=A0A1H3ITQ0_9RHOB|nr:threonine-phosphate decarboxylase CobD [Citreimonas salinaria]SDY30937.1 L-threonine O-3-phosphate decarboxylase [Citreimonas salinaria]